MKYMLNKIQIAISSGTLNIDPSCNVSDLIDFIDLNSLYKYYRQEVSLLLSTDDIEKLLGFIKPLTSHAKFRHVFLAGQNNAKLIRSILEFIDSKCLESLTIEHSEET